MRTDKLKTITISQDALEWLQEKYKAVDTMDATRYRLFLSEDCTLQFGNQPIVQCNNEIIGGIKHFWDAINGLDHSFISVIGTDTFLAAEAMIDYTRKDSSIVSIPCVTIIERNNKGLATSIRIFIDTTPIFQTLKV